MNQVLEMARTDLKEGMDIFDVCKKHNLSFSDLFYGLKKRKNYKPVKSAPAKYIYHNGKRFIIRKRTGDDNRSHDFGSFFDLEEALSVRDKLILNDWIVPDGELWLGDTYIRKTKDKFVVYKWLNGRNYYYGRYGSLMDARLVRDELVRCDWDKSQLPVILERLGVGVV